MIKLTDGFGLYLLVHANGFKYWYSVEGKQKVFPFEVYPAVALADARQLRDEVKRLLAQTIDPHAKKQTEAKERKAKCDNTHAFKVVAKSWFTRLC